MHVINLCIYVYGKVSIICEDGRKCYNMKYANAKCDICIWRLELVLKVKYDLFLYRVHAFILLLIENK